MQITFHGAAHEVTGSMHVIEAGGRRVALDCGLFQGRRAEAAEKNRQFGVDAKSLDAVVLSHAHIDHSGRIPLLAKQGFEGNIYCTPATRDLCAIMLADAAHIQQEDARYLRKRMAKRGETNGPIEPLYDIDDTSRAMNAFLAVPYRRVFHPAPGFEARYHEAGHMLGSAGISLTVRENGTDTRIVFTGDVGRPDIPILRDPAPLPQCDYLITESTYGGRRTQTNHDLKDRLEQVVRETFERGGKVIIPAFSVGRTQRIVYFLHQLVSEGRLAPVPVFIDSPLAVNATEVFRMHPECFDKEARAFDRETGDMLGGKFVTYVRSVQESKAINNRRKPCVVIAASGMCEAGRILHHLKNGVTSPKNTILIVGFQAAHTLGRRIVEREKHVRIFNEKKRLRAEVVVLNGFSAHADRDELHDVISPIAPNVRTAFLVHGEPDQMEAMSAWMKSDGFRHVVSPARGQTWRIGEAQAHSM
jgi:metallo-beta-lactamase family protein